FSTDGAPTIGGVVATNASGPRRVQAGACRDSLIGVRFVDGTGTAIKNGGRVMKNVTGYDLVKLMAGSYGTLGVLSEVAFKVLPGVAATRVLLVEGIGPDAAVSAMSMALGSPFEVSGAAYTSRGLDGAPVLMIRVEGFETSVEYRAGQLKELLSGIGDITIEGDRDKTAAGWAWVRDVSMFAGSDGDIWRVSVKPTDGTSVVAALEGAPYLMDWGGGLIWAELPADTDLRGRMAGIAGHATLVRADEKTKAALGVFHPEPAPLAALSRGIREKFDPRGILNPGLMG
ncbi:MAG: FAD-binding protein, partial [Alphaproteobacteria bacterium]|nr:FAD-binding protein [Alphaproteobacteria bacterium]